MNAKIKKAWVQALRSGRHTKCSGRLRAGKSLDGLGVLCDVVEPSGWKHGCHLGQVWFPSMETLQAAGLDRPQSIAIAERDSLSFEELAAYIEESL